MKTLQEKAMLVKLNISQWTARKHDKKVSQEVAQQHNAQGDAQAIGRYNKILIAQEEIKKIAKIANEARTFHYDNTLPWTDEGQRILPAKNYLPYTQRMRQLEGHFNNAVPRIISNYGFLMQEARTRLNSLWNANDYPTVDELQGKYSFTVQVSPIPDGKDFRVNLQTEEVERIHQEIEGRVNKATETALKDLWHRLHKAVAHMVERLNDMDKTFRNSLVGNLQGLVELLPRLNITDNPELEAIRQEIEDKLCQDPDLLRTNIQERKKTAQDAQDILTKMAGYVGSK